ncbi:MAG: hypothetical protein RL338_694 [Chloroflexota bacterium]
MSPRRGGAEPPDRPDRPKAAGRAGRAEPRRRTEPAGRTERPDRPTLLPREPRKRDEDADELDLTAERIEPRQPRDVTPGRFRPDAVVRGTGEGLVRGTGAVVRGTGAVVRGTGAAVRSTAATAAATTAAAATGSLGAIGLGPIPGAVGEADLARRETVFLAATTIALARLVEGPAVWAIGAIAAALVLVGSRRAIEQRSVGPVPREATLLPTAATVAAVAAIHLVPFGLWLIPALVVAGLVVDAAVELEARIAARPMGFTPLDRSLLLGLSILVAFIGFSGVGALVPDALVAPVAPGLERTPPPLASLVLLAAADAGLTFLLGYRFAALRAPLPELAARTAGTHAAAIAIAAGLFSAAALPRLLGPALLTLVFFLWESLVGAEAPTRRDPRFIWQILLLVVLGVVVIVWNLLIPR